MSSAGAIRLAQARVQRVAAIQNAVRGRQVNINLNVDTVKRAALSLANAYGLGVGSYKNIIYLSDGQMWTSSVQRVKKSIAQFQGEASKFHPGWMVVQNWNRLSRSLKIFDKAGDDIPAFIQKVERSRALSKMVTAAGAAQNIEQYKSKAAEKITKLSNKLLDSANRRADSYNQLYLSLSEQQRNDALKKFNARQKMFGVKSEGASTMAKIEEESG